MTRTASITGQAPSLGQILLSQEVISEKQLDNAIAEQRRTGARLGQALITSGACTEEDIASALARQLNLPEASLSAEAVDSNAAATLGEDYMRHHCCLPLISEQGVVRLAVADPFDVETTGDVSRILDKAVLVEVSTPREIIGTLDAISDHGCRIEAIIAEAQARAEGSDGALNQADLLSADEILKAFVSQGVRRGSADVHVEPEEDFLRIRFRVDGILQPGPMIPKEMSNPVIARIKIISNLDISERRLPQDGRSELEVDGRVYDLRVSVLPTVKGECIVMRVLDSSKALISEDKMGLSPETARFLRTAADRPHGLFLATGPTGSGKSTTLYGMLARVNALERKVITVEDPVEYRLPLIRQVQVHSEIGLTFASGLRSILRQDPDVILLGEIRDSETAEIAMRAAMTGHLVLSTLHTNSALGAIARLTDIGIDPFLVTSTLCGVVGQRLLRTVCEHCAETYTPDEEEIARFDPQIQPQISTFKRGTGCAFCSDSGFKGRTAVHEVLAMSNVLRKMVHGRATEDEMLEQARTEGFIPLWLDGQKKVMSGLTTIEEVQRVVLEAE